MAAERQEQIYKKGIPYAPDIKRLDEAFPMPEEGDTLSYEQLAFVLKLEKESTRFRSILTSWRRGLLRSRNIDTEAVARVGIKVLAPDERSKVREKDITNKARLLGRQRYKYALIPRERL